MITTLPVSNPPATVKEKKVARHWRASRARSKVSAPRQCWWLPLVLGREAQWRHGVRRSRTRRPCRRRLRAVRCRRTQRRRCGRGARAWWWWGGRPKRGPSCVRVHAPGAVSRGGCLREGAALEGLHPTCFSCQPDTLGGSHLRGAPAADHPSAHAHRVERVQMPHFGEEGGSQPRPWRPQASRPCVKLAVPKCFRFAWQTIKSTLGGPHSLAPRGRAPSAAPRGVRAGPHMACASPLCCAPAQGAPGTPPSGAVDTAEESPADRCFLLHVGLFVWMSALAFDSPFALCGPAFDTGERLAHLAAAATGGGGR